MLTWRPGEICWPEGPLSSPDVQNWERAYSCISTDQGQPAPTIARGVTSEEQEEKGISIQLVTGI